MQITLVSESVATVALLFWLADSLTPTRPPFSNMADTRYFYILKFLKSSNLQNGLLRTHFNYNLTSKSTFLNYNLTLKTDIFNYN
jgi:hypothetical protein